MSGGGFWLRWSLRDLRGRWVLVVAIALVIAIGTGVFTGLGSMETWRKRSNDESFALLNAHDLKVTLAEGSFARAGTLRRSVASLPGGLRVTGAQERLVTPTELDASLPGGGSALAAGELVGMDVTAPGRPIDAVHATGGRTLRPGDANAPVTVVETGFAKQAGLPTGTAIRIAGGGTLRTVGRGTAPDYFVVTRPGGGEFGGAESSFAVLFVPMRVAQAAAGRGGAVNQLVVTLPDGVDRDAAAAALERVLRARLPALGPTVKTRADEPAHSLLYKDAEGDQRVYRVLSWLLLAGAAFAAFNLASRVVESQRREIGVGMALGVTPRELAVRPLLLGAEIALLGAVLGLGVGLLIREPLRGALESLIPLPVVVTPFEPQVFARGAIIGFLLPLLATALPVWRAVRVQPVEAIRVGFRSAKGGGLAPLLRRVRLPGGSLAQMPARNVLRAPRRTLMTVLGIAAVIASLVAMLGMIDSILYTVDRAQAETAGRTPARLDVALDRFYPRDSKVVRGIAGDPSVAAAEPRIAVPARVSTRKASFDVGLQLVDSGSRMWRPTVSEGEFGRGAGLLLAKKAADDLGVGPGDTVLLRHPRRAGAAAFGIAETRVPVTGIHPDPFRMAAYMDASQAPLLGLEGATNRVDVIPAPGRSAAGVQRALFGDPGVTSVEPVTAGADLMEKRMDDFVGILRVMEGFVLLLAVLMAFNSSTIAADERTREHATMFAFGVPVRSVTRLAVVENLLMGVAATAAGLAIGLLLTRWVVLGIMPETFPQIGVTVSLSAGSIAAAALLGAAAVALAPLLTARRMRRMDVPSALRVVE